MIVLDVRNVHEALPRALDLMDTRGVQRESRNGPVMLVPGGVTTVYHHPYENVIFWAERDANPAFHLYEALWMLAGRNDIAPLVRYAKKMADFSDDGVAQHGAYGYRWRHMPIVHESYGDQLAIIVKRLQKNPDDRRCVLQMWEGFLDLNRDSKDVPCNLVATFQMNGAYLDLTVFCRSNDIVWGAYGANAVHFSVLHQYMAHLIGVGIGTYTQVSANWHIYLDWYEKLKKLPRPSLYTRPTNPYDAVQHLPMGLITTRELDSLLHEADSDIWGTEPYSNSWLTMVRAVLMAHSVWRREEPPFRFTAAMMKLGDSNVDWIVAMREWLQRRYDKWLSQR